jgi:hypothetical protein
MLRSNGTCVQHIEYKLCKISQIFKSYDAKQL